MKRLVTILLLPGLLSVAATGIAGEKMCTYSTYKWNVNNKSAVQKREVRHSYRNLAPFEIDPSTGCTVCREDQVTLSLEGLKPFRLCKVLAADVEYALAGLIADGVPIRTVTAYRVGMTRGQADGDGNRTEFSNHSFGIALDINEQQNGLYENCITYGSWCRLRRGGTWRPGAAGSLTANGPVVMGMKRIGLKWGGEIEGRQKDFMHFSPSGY